MPDSPDRRPLQALSGVGGLNQLDPATLNVISQIVAAGQSFNASQTSQNTQSVDKSQPDKQTQQKKPVKATWTPEEERCVAELKLAESDRKRENKKAGKKAGDMVSDVVSSCL